MEKDKTTNLIDAFSAFDHSYGMLCDGGVYYWMNRWGGKTFVKTTDKGVLEFAVVGSRSGGIAAKRAPTLEEINDNYVMDGEPGFQATTYDDLVKLVSSIIGAFIIAPDFIDRFLKPGRLLSESEKDEFDQYFYGSRDVPDGVKDYIKSMEYKDFLKTPYWREISMTVRRRRNNRCQLCGSTKALEVHHSDYSIHGDEIKNLDKLTLLCHQCHSKFHDKKN